MYLFEILTDYSSGIIFTLSVLALLNVIRSYAEVALSDKVISLLQRKHSGRSQAAGVEVRKNRLPDKALQTDKGKLSRLLHSQGSRQLAFAAELGR
jgi:hypothetical protein